MYYAWTKPSQYQRHYYIAQRTSQTRLCIKPGPSLHNIKDIITLCREQAKQGYVLSLDQTFTISKTLLHCAENKPNKAMYYAWTKPSQYQRHYYIKQRTSQTRLCIMPGPSLHNIKDIITLSREQAKHGYVLSLDQGKTFDRVNHDYLHNTIERRNLGKYISEIG